MTYCWRIEPDLVPRLFRIAFALVLAVCMFGASDAGVPTSVAHAGSSEHERGEARPEPSARAAVAPLAGMLVCSRLCPVAGGAAARLIYRAPRQIRHVPAPEPALAQRFSTAAGSSPGNALGLALTRGNRDLARALRARGFQAHHIVAHGHPRAEFARMVLQIRGIGPNAAVNGVWLRAGAHGGIHSNAYFHNVNRLVGKYHFNPFLPRAQLVEDLRRIGTFLQSREFPL